MQGRHSRYRLFDNNTLPLLDEREVCSMLA